MRAAATEPTAESVVVAEASGDDVDLDAEAKQIEEQIKVRAEGNVCLVLRRRSHSSKSRVSSYSLFNGTQ